MIQNFYLGDISHSLKSPQYGYKRIHVMWNEQHHTLSFQGLWESQHVKRKDRAKCAKRGMHLVPSTSCTCGFCAYFDYNDAKNHLQGGTWTQVVKIEATGKIIGGEKGMRYRGQEIIQIVQPTTCLHCSRESRYSCSTYKNNLLVFLCEFCARNPEFKVVHIYDKIVVVPEIRLLSASVVE